MDQRTPRIGRKLAWTAALVLATGGLMTGTASAQSMDMHPDVNKAKQGSKWYVHGMSMAQVAKRFGEPTRKVGPVPKVGTKLNPPITRWEYPGFVVYFEKGTALHLVKQHKK